MFVLGTIRCYENHKVESPENFYCNEPKKGSERILQKLNQVMDYIEDHLNEYIRVRRLSKASKTLQQGISVTEAAYKYGYHSLEGSFSLISFSCFH